MAEQKMADDERSSYYVFEDCSVNTKCLRDVTASGQATPILWWLLVKTTEF